MGLFCQVLHVADTDPSDVKKALDEIMKSRGFANCIESSIDAGGPGQKADNATAPAYIVGPLLGHWVPIIDLFADPWPGEICTELSQRLSTYSLILMVHDDDVMFYNLDHNGASLDGYNSNPQFFENEKLEESAIESQRHTPEALQALIPERDTAKDMLEILNAGWWSAHDQGRLDADGVMTDEDWDACPYEDEAARMQALGSILGLVGAGQKYPFVDWRGGEGIAWAEYRFCQYGQ